MFDAARDEQTVENSTQLEQLIPDCWYEVGSDTSGIRFVKVLCPLNANETGMTHVLLLRNGHGNETAGEWNNSTFNRAFSDVRKVEIRFDSH